MTDGQPDDFARIAHQLGAKVRHRRQALGLTQEELAHRVGKDRKAIQNVEYGRSSTPGRDGTYGPGNPKLDMIFKLSIALELDLGYLVDPDRDVANDARA